MPIAVVVGFALDVGAPFPTVLRRTVFLLFISFALLVFFQPLKRVVLIAVTLFLLAASGVGFIVYSIPNDSPESRADGQESLGHPLFLPVLQAIRESLRVDSHSDLDNTHQETPRSTVDGRRLFERMTWNGSVLKSSDLTISGMRRVHSNGQAMLVQILQVPLGDREVRLTLACREDEKTVFLPVLQAIRESLRVDSHSDLDNTHQETPRSTVDGRRLFERMTERAIERNPEVNLTEALTREAKAMEERMVNDLGTSDEVKEVEAASAFWGYFLRSTRATIQYCETLGVAAVDFAAEFTAQHSAEMAQAGVIDERHDTDREAVWELVSPNILRDLVSQEMETSADMLDMSTKELCRVVNDYPPDTIAEAHFSAVFPQLHEILMRAR